MISLKIYLDVDADKEQELISTFSQAFKPDIKKQEGFKGVYLLKKLDSLRQYQINMYFTNEKFRLKWVDSTEHQTVWPKIAACCVRCSWEGFEVIDQ